MADHYSTDYKTYRLPLEMLSLVFLDLCLGEALEG